MAELKVQTFIKAIFLTQLSILAAALTSISVAANLRPLKADRWSPLSRRSIGTQLPIEAEEIIVFTIQLISIVLYNVLSFFDALFLCIQEEVLQIHNSRESLVLKAELCPLTDFLIVLFIQKTLHAYDLKRSEDIK